MGALNLLFGQTKDTATPSNATQSRLWPGLLLYPVCFGVLAAFGLVAFYLGVITLAQGWSHALQQLAEDKWFIAALVGGFGTQVGLVVYLHNLHVRTSKGSVAASTTTSVSAMLACCAHHLVDILPIAGLSGAALFLSTYKLPLLWLGILMNLAAITFMVWKIYQHQKKEAALSEILS